MEEPSSINKKPVGYEMNLEGKSNGPKVCYEWKNKTEVKYGDLR